MKKSIFIIRSEFYCEELLARYIERESSLRTFEFFNAEETLLYMGLEPSLIVYGSSDPAFTPRQLKLISQSLAVAPIFIAVSAEKVLEFAVNEGHRLQHIDSSEYYDVYSSIRAQCADKFTPALDLPAVR